MVILAADERDRAVAHHRPVVDDREGIHLHLTTHAAVGVGRGDHRHLGQLEEAGRVELAGGEIIADDGGALRRRGRHERLARCGWRDVEPEGAVDKPALRIEPRISECSADEEVHVVRTRRRHHACDLSRGIDHEHRKSRRIDEQGRVAAIRDQSTGARTVAIRPARRIGHDRHTLERGVEQEDPASGLIVHQHVAVRQVPDCGERAEDVHAGG
ncbi:MAG: hypothetical protein M3Z10_12130 [Gemmatimonadota bacterium]|nr:hypothetical protein [Gemmatimonadota bacterium]